VLKSATSELGWVVDDLFSDASYVETGKFYKIGSTVRECNSGFRALTPVLKAKKIPFTVTPIREGWFSAEINERGQFEIKTDDVVYLNYSVKFNLSILNNSDSLAQRSRTDIFKLIQKSQSGGIKPLSESSDEAELEEFDFDAFNDELYNQAPEEGYLLEELLQSPEFIFEEGGFDDFDISDFFESFSEEPKRYHSEMLRELRNWLYRDHTEDDPTTMSKETALQKLQWLYLKQETGLHCDEFSEFITQEYCQRIGIKKETLWPKFQEVETESVPIEMLSFKTYVRSNKMLRAIESN
jgi:hypothetical protein